jgi:hypothetical protein
VCMVLPTGAWSSGPESSLRTSTSSLEEGTTSDPGRRQASRAAEGVVIGSVVLVVLIIIALVVSCAPLPDQPTRRTPRRRT